MAISVLIVSCYLALNVLPLYSYITTGNLPLVGLKRRTNQSRTSATPRTTTTTKFTRLAIYVTESFSSSIDHASEEIRQLLIDNNPGIRTYLLPVYLVSALKQHSVFHISAQQINCPTLTDCTHFVWDGNKHACRLKAGPPNFQNLKPSWFESSGIVRSNI